MYLGSGTEPIHPAWSGPEILAIGQDLATGTLTHWEATWLLERGPSVLPLLIGWPPLEIAKVYAGAKAYAVAKRGHHLRMSEKRLEGVQRRYDALKRLEVPDA
jgi:hypothetical protein